MFGCGGGRRGIDCADKVDRSGRRTSLWYIVSGGGRNEGRWGISERIRKGGEWRRRRDWRFEFEIGGEVL
jgi:hypothetical protein